MYKKNIPYKKKYYHIVVLLSILELLISCKEDKKSFIINELQYIKTINWQYDADKNLIITYPELHKRVEIKPEELPIGNCMIATTPAIAYLEELNKIDKIQAVSNPNYIYNEKVQQNIVSKIISKLGNDSQWNIEGILKQKIKYIFTSYNPNFLNTYTFLENQGVKIIFLEEYKENIPLARAEMLLLFGVLFHEEGLAKQKFSEVEKNYNSLMQLAQKSTKKPSVMAKIMYEDVWYMPQGESFAANLYKDAYAHYFWSETKGNGSLTLNFEQVYNKAKDSDYWLEVGDFMFKKDLLNYNAYYKDFKPYKNNNLYSISNAVNAIKANNYYERGVFRVDEVLQDIIAIIHPELLPNYKLKYYKQLH